jgi:hypothetical protein
MAVLRNFSWNRGLLFGGILFFGLLAMTARHATDPDLWWHLRTGQWIAETGHIPHSDPFSFTRGGSPWVSHEWLSDLIFYRLWQFGGPAALIVFSAIITSLGFLLLYLRCAARPHWAAAATLLGALAAAPCWGVRPQMFTFTLASLLLWLIERAQIRPRVLLWIPPLFVLWLNLHAGFALGPALLLSYFGGLILEAATGTTPWPEARPLIRRTLAVTAACLALVPLNPSGSQLYRYPLDTLRSPGMRSFIVEWFSPDFHKPLYLAFLLILLLLLTALARSRSPVRGRVLFPLILTCFAALDAVRHIPIFVLLAIPVLASTRSVFTTSNPAKPSPRPSRLSPLFGTAVLILIAVFALSRWVDLARTQSAHAADEFPQGAITYLRAHPQSSRIFAYYDWGGYAIWRLYPQYRVFVDGRADLYGDNFLKEFQSTVQLHTQDWQATFRNWGVEAVLIPPNSPLAQALTLDPAWISPYHDARSVLFFPATGLPPDQLRGASPVENTQK